MISRVLTLLDLFSGIGGFSLAASWAGIETVAFVENEPFCQKVLAKNFPGVKIYGDIKEFDGREYRGTVDIVSGGPPCQPVSICGRRNGKNDDRWLWPEMYRILREVAPQYAIYENPTGILDMGFDEIISDMEALGYAWEAFVVPACSKNAPHKRERVWLVAYSKGVGLSGERKRIISLREETENVQAPMWLELLFQGDTVPYVCRSHHGASSKVDRNKALGNAIVPQVAYQFFKAIVEIEQCKKTA